jgi:hypothetical protein
VAERHARELTRRDAAIARDGVAIAAGATHVWDVPAGMRLMVAGDAGVRFTCLGAAGRPLVDLEAELAGGQSRELTLPAGTAVVAVTCLGRAESSARAGAADPPAPGGLTGRLAPAGAWPVWGWQIGHQLALVGATTLLARGACVILGGPSRARAGAGERLVFAHEVLRGPAALETRLPPGTETIVLLLDVDDAGAADAGDLALAVSGATLGPPRRVGGARRRALVYEVVGREDGAQHVGVSVASRTGWRLAGVAGARGRAAEWTARLGAGIPDVLVPEGPLSPAGSANVRLVPAPPEVR